MMGMMGWRDSGSVTDGAESKGAAAAKPPGWSLVLT